jgi:hypothetical protein
LVAASVAGLALAGPGSAQLGATQSQSGSNGALQAVVTNVQVTENTVQAPVQVNAPVRVLSPGNNTGGGEARAEASGGGSSPASQSQSGSNGAAQVGVTNVQVAGSTVQAPARVVLPIRILSPGEDRLDAGATAAADGGGNGSASQSQNGENGALQALLTSIQVVGITAQAPISVYAPARVLSPGDNGGGATASADTGGGGSGSATQTQNGENGTAQARVTNVQVADNTAQAPVAVTAPVRVLSPGGDTAGPGGGTGPGGGGPGGGGTGPGGDELGAGTRGSASGSVIETLAATAGGASLPFTGAPLVPLVLLGAALMLLGLRLRASGAEPVR